MVQILVLAMQFVNEDGGDLFCSCKEGCCQRLNCGGSTPDLRSLKMMEDGRDWQVCSGESGG